MLVIFAAVFIGVIDSEQRTGECRYFAEADQQAFLAQKDQADGKKTLRAYYWYICGREYDQEHGNG